jgi:stage III sporulation protein AA
MSPKVIAMDEIGAKDDVMSIGYAMRCGVKILATIHGESMDEIKEKPYVRELLHEKVFERYVVLKQNSIGKIEAIYDEEQRVCC